jgi:hypothetical protein
LEAGKDKSPIEAVEIGEDSGDAGCLLAVKAGGFVDSGGATNQGGEDGAAEVGVFDYAGEGKRDVSGDLGTN